MTNTPILDKNLEIINKYNPVLANKIKSLDIFVNSITLGETKLNEPNLIYNGLALHSNEGAEAESEKTFTLISNTKDAMHIVFGLGLGYLFQQYALNSKGTVILVEPSIEVLRTTLELVDFSKELSNENVFVVDNLETFSTFFSKHYKKGVDLSCGFLKSYKILYPQLLSQIPEQMKTLVGDSNIVTNYYSIKLPNVIQSFCRSIKYTIKETPFIELKNIYQNKPAVIVSAGPTLDNNIEKLKENQNKVVIISVGAALKTLIKNGITPDFTVFLEQFYAKKIIEDIDFSKLNIILEPSANEQYHKLPAKNVYSYPSSNSPTSKVWSQYSKADISPYDSSGTVSYIAMNCAKLLGCKQIILIGQDLAYIEGQCYNKNNSYDGLSCVFNEKTNTYEIHAKDFDEFKNSLFSEYKTQFSDEQLTKLTHDRLKHLNENLHHVKGINGNMLPTEIDYASFIPAFTEFAKNNPDLKLINTSLKGAQIDGFENIALEDVLKPFEEIEKIKLKTNSKPNFKQILSELNSEITNLDGILEIIKNANDLCLKIDKEFSYRKIFNDTCKKYYSELYTQFKTLNSKYLKTSPIFYCISLTVNQELQKALDNNEIQTIYNGLKKYFYTIQKTTNTVNDLYLKNSEELNEICNTES